MPSGVVTSTIRSFEAICREADPKLDEEQNRPVVYQFSNRREFKAPFPRYGTST